MTKTYKFLFTLLFSISLHTHLQAIEVPLVTAPKMPLMSMTDTNGKTYKVQGTEEGLKIEGLEGKIVLLEFFGHRCPPCLASIPHLINLQKKHKDKLAIVSIEVQGKNTEQMSSFAKEKGINYIVASEETASNLVAYVQQRAQWQGSIPFLVALDTKGVVQFVQAGMLPEKSLEELIVYLSDKNETVSTKKETSATKNTSH